MHVRGVVVLNDSTVCFEINMMVKERMSSRFLHVSSKFLLMGVVQWLVGHCHVSPVLVWALVGSSVYGPDKPLPTNNWMLSSSEFLHVLTATVMRPAATAEVV